MLQTIASALPEEQFRQLESSFFQSRPGLKKLVQTYGDYALVDYMTSYFSERLIQPVPERQTELLKTLQAYAANHWGEDAAQIICEQLKGYYCVSTADHHAPLYPDFAFQANVLTMAAYAQLQQPQLQAILVFSCSSVSLNHRDWPRGLMYHRVHERQIQAQRLSFFPSRLRMDPVYHCAAYRRSDLEILSEHYPIALEQIVNQCYAAPEVLAAPDYNTQIALSNKLAWQLLTDRFQWYPTQLYYFAEEKVVAQLLLDHHLHTTTPLHQLLFSDVGQQQWWPSFARTFGSYLSQGGAGTDFFWAVLPGKARRIALILDNGYLVSSDQTVRYALEPSAIAQALREGSMFPNLLLCYIVLVLYYQLNCLGGFNQTHYVPALQAEYNALKVDPLYRPANATQLHYGLYSAFLYHQQNALPLTGLDLWLHGQDDFWSEWSGALQTVSVAQALQWLVPSFYRYLPPAEQARYSETELTKFILTANIDQHSVEKSVPQPALVSI